MIIHQMIQTLERRLEMLRRYSIPEGGRLITLIDDYLSQERTKRTRRGHKPEHLPRKKHIVCSDMCIAGPGTQPELASRWGIQLPADYLAFCGYFEEYIFAGKIPIRMMDSSEIEDNDGARDAWDIPKSAPRRLFEFARVVEEPAHFAFRWSEDYTSMDVVYSWDYGDIGEPILLGEHGDRFVSDQTFTGWLQRMLETDCCPVFPGKRVPTSSGWMKQDRVPLVQIE